MVKRDRKQRVEEGKRQRDKGKKRGGRGKWEGTKGDRIKVKYWDKGIKGEKRRRE